MHRPRCALCRDVTRIGNIFVKGIKFLEEGGGQERLVEMGFGGNGAVWSVRGPSRFSVFFAVRFCELWGKKKGGKVTHRTPNVWPSRWQIIAPMPGCIVAAIIGHFKSHTYPHSRQKAYPLARGVYLQ